MCNAGSKLTDCKYDFDKMRFFNIYNKLSRRHGGLMVSALVPGASSPGLSSGQEHGVMFLGKTLSSHSVSPPRSINGYQQIVGET